MTSNRTHDDRETLSALFDSQLQGDEARFALKRLGHDVQWREACGRWQLYGDVLRGQGGAIAAGGFAERVAVAIARETPLQSTATTSTPARTVSMHRGWIGGALAASVALVALFVARPFPEENAPTSSDAPAQVASAPTSGSTPLPAAPEIRTPAPTPVPQAPDQTAGLAAAVAVAEVPRRAVERRASRGQSQRAALRAGRQQTLPAVATATATAPSAVAVLESTTPAPASTNPFHPEHAEVASRPWPRAVLPQYSGGNTGMTASFGNTSSSRSFYPFEPQSVQEPSAPAATDDGDPLQR